MKRSGLSAGVTPRRRKLLWPWAAALALVCLTLAGWTVASARFHVMNGGSVPRDFEGLLYVAVDLTYNGRLPARVKSVELLQPRLGSGLSAVIAARSGGGITDHLPPVELRDDFPLRMTRGDYRQFVVPVQVPTEPGEYVRVHYSVLGIPRGQLLPAQFWLGQGESPFHPTQFSESITPAPRDVTAAANDLDETLSHYAEAPNPADLSACQQTIDVLYISLESKAQHGDAAWVDLRFELLDLGKELQAGIFQPVGLRALSEAFHSVAVALADAAETGKTGEFGLAVGALRQARIEAQELTPQLRHQ